MRLLQAISAGDCGTFCQIPKSTKASRFPIVTFPSWPASIMWRALRLIVRTAPGGQTTVLKQFEDNHAFHSRDEADTHAIELAKQ